jgi:hypothetical protein
LHAISYSGAKARSGKKTKEMDWLRNKPQTCKMDTDVVFSHMHWAFQARGFFATIFPCGRWKLRRQQMAQKGRGRKLRISNNHAISWRTESFRQTQENGMLILYIIVRNLNLFD